MINPLCFVLVPFGEEDGYQMVWKIDFDAVYAQIIKSGPRGAGLNAICADENREWMYPQAAV
jgi:hypothetical protein